MNLSVRDLPPPDFDALFREPPGRGVAIRLRSLAKSFGATPVLRNLDLDVPAGQFLAVVGRSGSGKSTLLRLLSGLDRPSAGSIAFGEANEAEPPQAMTRVMFQEPRLLPWARVLENGEIGLGNERDKQAGRERATEMLAEVGLESRAGDWPAILSGSQKQRIALARALVSRPRCLALDEPLGALDALTRIDMQQLIGCLWGEQRFTAVLVTHDVGEALTLADRVVLIENGTITLDLAVELPRPRRRSSPELARLEERILRNLLQDEARPRNTSP